MKRKIGFTLASFFLFLLIAGVPVYAASSPSSAPSVQTQGNNGTGGQGGLDVSPVSRGKVIQGFNKMGNDMKAVGQSMSYPLFMFGIVLGLTMFVFGAVLSKKLMNAGLITCVASFVTLLVLGDVGKATAIFTSIANAIRSYF
jgi:hypothetical protein